MRLLDEPELCLIPNPHAEEDDYKRELSLNGLATGKFVDGTLLEAAIQSGQRYLLLLTDDTPQEEILSIQLFDAGFALLDIAWLGGPYSTGHFRDLQLIEPNLIHFHFIDNKLWEIEILDQPVFHIPFFSEPTGITRRPGFKKHFRINVIKTYNDAPKGT